MLVKRAYKFRLYPNAEQEQALARQCGASRCVYNHFLRARIDYHLANKDSKKKGLTYHDTALMLTQLKQQPDYAWLKEANAQALQQALRDLDTAYRNFFDHRARFPRFKRKHNRQSFRVPQGFRTQDDRLVIAKVSPIKMVIHRPIEGTMKQVTVSRTKIGHYYASITDSGWGEFVRQLTYKGAWYGCQLVHIDRFFPSSKRCAACGFINQDLRLSDRDWTCPACGVIHDRDHNAAANILMVGRATAGAAESHAGGEDVRRFSEARPRRNRKLPVSNGE